MTGRSGIQKTKTMTTKQRSFLVNFNRSLIFALTLAGLLLDGYQHSDLPVTLALGIWLWQAACCRAQKFYRDHGIGNNAMLHTLLIRIT